MRFVTLTRVLSLFVAFTLVPMTLASAMMIGFDAGANDGTLDETDFLVIDTVDKYSDLVFTPGYGQHPDSLVINPWLAQDMQWCGSPSCAVYIAAIGYNGSAVMGEHVDVPAVVSRAPDFLIPAAI